MRARTVQYRLKSGEFNFENAAIPMRVSIGCEPFGPHDLISRANMAMYCIKRRRAPTSCIRSPRNKRLSSRVQQTEDFIRRRSPAG